MNTAYTVKKTKKLQLKPGNEFFPAVKLLPPAPPPGGYKPFEHSSHERHRIITFAGQTDDVPHVAAALAADPLTDVLLISYEDKKTQDQARDSLRTFESAIEGEKYEGQSNYEKLSTESPRVKHLILDSGFESSKVYEALSPEGRALAGWSQWRTTQHISSLPEDYWTYKNARGVRIEYVSVSVWGATALVAKAYRSPPWKEKPEEFCKFMTNRLSSHEPKLKLEEIETWAVGAVKAAESAKADPSDLARLLALKERKQLLLVWSRYSGQNTPDGYNPAGDSDYVKGQTQLIDLAKKLPGEWTTVTIGHGPTGGSTPKGEYHLGEFWTQEKTPFDKEGRPGQTSLYTYLRSRHHVVQIGQKTGGMDTAALFGIQTVYIEDVGSPSETRMKMWADAMGTYKRAIISQPPTMMGKLLRSDALNSMKEKDGHREAKRMMDKENWDKKTVADKQKLEIEKFKSGYEDKDLDKIREALVAGAETEQKRIL